MASINKIVRILSSDIFVNYSDSLPFSDSDQSEMRFYLKHHPNEVQEVYDFFLEVKKILEDFDDFDDEDDEESEEDFKIREEKFHQKLTDSRLLKWHKEKYSV